MLTASFSHVTLEQPWAVILSCICWYSEFSQAELFPGWKYEVVGLITNGLSVFCSHSQLQIFWFHFKTVISPNSLRNPKRCLTCVHVTVLSAAPWNVPPHFCPPLAPPCHLRLTTLVPEEEDQTCPPMSQSSCALSL